MKIVDTIQKIPAGWLLVPTIIGAVIHTFCPQVLEIGDPTQVLFTRQGMQLCIGFMLFCTGTQLSLSDLRLVAREGLPFLAFKFVVAYALAIGFLLAFGQQGVFGISFLAFAVAITSCNGALYMALVSPFARRVDLAVFGILCLVSMPVLPMILLSGSAGAGVNWLSVVSMLVPLVAGFALGCLDEKFRAMFRSGTACIMPFLGFQFGSLIDLRAAAPQVPAGLLLTLVFYVLSVVPLYAFERTVLHGEGYTGVASCSVAGVALSVPSMAVAAVPAYAPYFDAAMSQLAMIMFLTTFVTPMLTQLAVRRAKAGTSVVAPAPADSPADSPAQK